MSKKGAYNKKPGPLNKSPKYRCVYNPAEHGISFKLHASEPNKPCGKITANNGTNRFYCQQHMNTISLRGED